MLIERLFWPPNPQPESWNSDTPNEGLIISEEGETLDDYFADYQGHTILEAPDDGWFNLAIRPTDNSQYLAAYSAITAACAPFQGQGRQVSWRTICLAIVEALEGLGWREVVPVYSVKEGAACFKWKPSKEKA